MMRNYSFILLLIFTVFFIGLNFSELVVYNNNVNGHSYVLVKSETEITYTDAITECKTIASDSYGYLATISSQNEWNWLKNQVLNSTENPENIWISGETLENGDIIFGQGTPESLLSDKKIYNFIDGECTGFCDFQFDCISNKQNGSLYLLNSADQFKWSNLPTLTTSNFYLCEIGGLDETGLILTELVLGSSPSQGSIGVPYLLPSSVENVNGIKFTLIGSETSFNVFINGNDSITVPSGSGVYIATILTTEGEQTTGFTIFSYQSPVVNAIYPPATADTNLITIVGENFGVNASKIKVSFGAQQCDSIQIIKPHQAITCSTEDSIPKYQIISVSVDNIVSSENSRISIYDSVNNLFLLNLNLNLNSSENTQFISEIEFNNQVLGSSTCIKSEAQFNLLKSMINGETHKYWIPTVKVVDVDGVFQFQEDGVKIDCYGDLPTQEISTLLFNLETVTYEEAAVEGRFESLVFFSTQDVPEITSSLTIVSPTSGKDTIIDLSNYGYLLSKVEILINTERIPVEISEFGSINYQVPAGYSNTSFSIFVDDRETVDSITITYLPATITAMSLVDTETGLVNITGQNFYNQSSIIQVMVDGQPCDDVVVIKDSVQLQCVLTTTQRVGILNTTVQIDTNAPSEIYNFAISNAPVISMIKGCAVEGKPLTITGTDFGNSTILIQASIGGIECTTITFLPTDPNTFTCIIGTGSITTFEVTVNVGGQTNQSPIELLCQGTPTVTSITPIPFNNNDDIPTITIIGENLLSSSVEITFSAPTSTPSSLKSLRDEPNSCIVNNVSTSSQLICTPSIKPLNDMIFKIKVSDEYSFDNIFEYTTVQINDIQQSGTIITIIGSGFGQNMIITPLLTSCTLEDESTLYCNLPTTYNSSLIQIESVNNATYNFLITPYIESIDINTATNNVTINCYFLELEANGEPNVYVVIENDDEFPVSFGGDFISYISGADFSQINKAQIKVTTDTKTRISNELSFSTNPVINNITLDLQDPTLLSIIGVNFNTVENVVYFGDTPITPISSSSSLITLMLLDTLEADEYSVYVQVGAVQSNTMQFSLYLTITEVSTPVYNIPGLTITGTRFCTSQENFTITINNNIVPAETQNTSFISIDYPNSDAFNVLNLTIKCNDNIALSHTYNYAQFNATSIKQVNKTIDIIGDNLGLANDFSIVFASEPTIKFTCTQENPNEKINCILPDNSVSGTYKISTPIYQQDMEIDILPVLDSIKLMDGEDVITALKTVGGQTIIIKGSFFVNNLIIINNDIETDTIYTFDSTLNEIQYTSSPGSGKVNSIAVKLTKGSEDISNSLPYSYVAPTITSLSVEEKNILIIKGDNFGLELTDNKLNVEGSQVLEVSIDTKVMKVSIPANSTSLKQIVLTVADQSTLNPEDLLLTPVIQEISPKPVTQGDTVTVVGYFLYPDETYEMYSIVADKETKLECNKSVTALGTVTCTIPAGLDYFKVKMVSSEALKLPSNVIDFSYLEPQITTIHYNYKPIVDTAEVTIVGKSFGSKTLLPSIITLNGTIKCEKLVYIDDTRVACSYKTENPLNITNIPVYVKVSSLVSNVQASITYPTCPNQCGVGGICTAYKDCFCYKGYDREDGVCQVEINDDDSDDDEKSSGGWKIAVGILVPVIFIASVVGIIFYLRARKRSSYERYSNKYFMQMEN